MTVGRGGPGAGEMAGGFFFTGFAGEKNFVRIFVAINFLQLRCGGNFLAGK